MIFLSFSLCVPSYSSRSLASTLSSRYSPVTGSMSPGSASQILARKKRRGVSGLGHWMLVGSVSFSVESATQFAFFFLMQIIEKRRRDRINHSLSELRRLVPSAFEKQVRNEFEMMIFFVIVRQ